MKYLVTGGLGVIGSRFVDVVVRLGHSVTIIDAAEEPRNLWTESRLLKDYGSKVSILKRRVESTDMASLLLSHSAVLHAAAHTGIPHSENDPTDDWESNVTASRNILEAMRRIRQSDYGLVPPVVMLSSVKPYRVHDLPSHTVGDRTVLSGRYINGIDETCLLEPDEPYAASKMAQSGLVMAYARTYDLPVTVLRCSNLYGDAPCHGPRHGWLTWFCISSVIGRDIEIQGDGLQTRDMLFSDDVASAVLSSFIHMNSMSGNVYNIGGGLPNSVSVREAAEIVSRLSGSVKVRSAAGRRNEDMVFATNHSKFTSSTGWYPTVSVQDGISRILEWAKANSDDLRTLYSGLS